MLTVHHLENSRSQRLLWLLEEMGVDYEIRRYERDPKTGLAPAELAKVHPLGKSPVLVDGETTLAETGAIVEYLMDSFDNDRLRPAAGTPGRQAYNYWLHYAEGTFMPLMIVSLILRRMETAPMPFFVKPVAKGIAGKVRDAYLDANVRRNLDFMEHSLSDREWFCGDRLSAADCQMSFPVEAAEARAGLANYPNLQRFIASARSRPAWQRALDKGGPYELAPFNPKD